jgi:adenosylmethionine-8-amino-7-oxononanoate aminotransferase
MSITERDQSAVWHPYTDKELYGNPIPVVSASDAYLFDEKGKKYIDAISSWWTTLHGHSHPHIVQKVSEQIKKLDHVIFSGFTHETAVLLAEKLLRHLPSDQGKIFYSDNGSTAVEVALKMAFQYWHNNGQVRNKVIAFKNSYHGDTFGAMSVSSRGTFTRPFQDLLFDVIYIDVPLKGKEKEVIKQFKKLITGFKSRPLGHENHKPSSFIFEPLVQGTAGMIMYEPDTLNELLLMCKENEILTIADEVMTGFGRTGKFFACDHLSVQPDLLCLSKGLTGGTMGMGITSCTRRIYEGFNSDPSKSFFHGHSYTGNPIACSAAIASLEIFEMQDVFMDIARISEKNKEFVSLVSAHVNVKDARSRGTILAIELSAGKDSSYFSEIRNKAYHFFINKGILMRPLGNIIYLLPPYCISNEDLNYIYKTIEEFLETL